MENRKQVMTEGEKREMVGKTYRHFKGGVYVVFGFTMDSETLEPTVIYYNLTTKQFWNRPLANFIEKVTLPDGSVVDRFQCITQQIITLKNTEE